MVEALLDSGATWLVMSFEFAKKAGVQVKKDWKIYIRNIKKEQR